MNDYRRPSDARRAGARILDTAEGVLVALRRCRLDRAFVEIMQTAKQNNVDPVGLADALVALAEDQVGVDVDDAAAAVALSTWGYLFSADQRVGAAADLNTFAGEDA
ncbi:ANTAR domain-containing protein [Mycobacterium heckeshornense]|uniref:Uncharacterized protein n=1 Tax=Mycobacterium heckeshornense TaxID=110505 RepID=A0A2G8B5U6_9MYCO|nr:ANTAR domain-containing protein [Mycobacterium heckeshornense]KMV22727.1 hypothetical protein ACT16_09595 [Mycobacterium heckeshornense]MCV7033945.1 ANTAR domain-containing protein [Mycobacterium heckeshornense]PIJ33155.1 ANTAR domain-containing protein [Mycobacterium heckeshornense]BCO37250.1 hypothetical protein MHEC_36830 [Mycobacterium heckeshornense]